MESGSDSTRDATSIVQSFSNYLQTAPCMPAPVEGGMDIAVDKAGQLPSLTELTFKEGRKEMDI